MPSHALQSCEDTFPSLGRGRKGESTMQRPEENHLIFPPLGGRCARV